MGKNRNYVMETWQDVFEASEREKRKEGMEKSVMNKDPNGQSDVQKGGGWVGALEARSMKEGLGVGEQKAVDTHIKPGKGGQG